MEVDNEIQFSVIPRTPYRLDIEMFNYVKKPKACNGYYKKSNKIL